MGSLSETVNIEASPARVWAVLSDFGGVAAWNPGVASAKLLTPAHGGVGAERRCELRSGPKDHIHERIIGWRENAQLDVEIAGTNAPIKRGTMSFVLRSEGSGTNVIFAMDYDLKFGPVGKLMDAMMVRKEMTRSAKGILKGLKRHVEAPRAEAVPAHSSRVAP